MMTLYDYFRSSACYRVRIALNLKGLEYRTVPIALLEGGQRAPDYIARNPQGLVPALEHDGVTMTQSFAIIDWLDRTFPGPRLIPEDAAERAHALALTMAIACDIHPLNNTRVLNRLAGEYGLDKPARDVWYAHWIALGFEAIEALAGDGPFLGGAAPNIADVFLVPQMANARRVPFDFAPYPKLVAADAAACALPAFAAAHPDRAAQAS